MTSSTSSWPKAHSTTCAGCCARPAWRCGPSTRSSGSAWMARPARRAVARCRELSRYAQAIECPWVLVVPGPTEGRTDAQVTSDTVATLRELADTAAEFGISVAFEFMGFPWAAVRDVTGAWAIVQQVSRTNLGIIVDTAHFYAGGSTLESIRQVDPERIVVLHINDVEDVSKLPAGF